MPVIDISKLKRKDDEIESRKSINNRKPCPKCGLEG